MFFYLGMLVFAIYFLFLGIANISTYIRCVKINIAIEELKKELDNMVMTTIDEYRAVEKKKDDDIYY